MVDTPLAFKGCGKYRHGRPAVAKALLGSFVGPDPVAAAQVQALRRRVSELEVRVLMLEAELAATEQASDSDRGGGQPALI